MTSAASPDESSLPHSAPSEQQLRKTPAQLLREGQLHFCGTPAAYAEILLTRCLRAAASTAPTPTPTPTLDAAGIERWAKSPANLPIISAAGLPVLFGPREEIGRHATEAWLAQSNAIPLAERSERAHFLGLTIAGWLAHERRNDAAELIGIIALEEYCLEGLWREIQVMIDGQLIRVFRTPNEFVATVLAHWQRGASSGRVSHLRTCARLWRRLRARQLPTPPNLSRLEPICRRGDAVDLYQKLVAANRGLAPTASQILAAVESPEGSTAATGKPSQLARVLAVADEIQAYATQRADPHLSALVTRLLNEGRRSPKAHVKRPPPRNLPRYDPALPCPFSFTEHVEPEGSRHLTIDVAPLPHPMPYRAQSTLPPKASWGVKADVSGAIQIVVELSNSPSQAHAQKAQAYAWAIALCRDMHAPMPDDPAEDLTA